MTTINYNAEIIQAADFLRKIQWAHLGAGLDSWKEKTKSFWEIELKKLSKENVDYAKEINEKSDRELREMATDRKKSNQKTIINSELDGRFYF